MATVPASRSTEALEFHAQRRSAVLGRPGPSRVHRAAQTAVEARTQRVPERLYPGLRLGRSAAASQTVRTGANGGTRLSGLR